MMRLSYIIIILLFLISCKTVPVTSNPVLEKEIHSYYLNGHDTIVDIGCGNGLHATYISHFFPSSYFVLEDIDTTSINLLRKNRLSFYRYIKDRYTVILGKPDSIPLPSSSFKVLLCRKTLHEFTDTKKMIQEMNRILIIGGRLIIVEVQPIKKGEIDRYCKKLLIPKEKIIDSVQKEKFRFISETEFAEKNDRRLSVLIFEKL